MIIVTANQALGEINVGQKARQTATHSAGGVNRRGPSIGTRGPLVLMRCSRGPVEAYLEEQWSMDTMSGVETTLDFIAGRLK